MTEETLFHAALAKPTAEREAFLDEACRDQPELRVAVAALLAAHEEAGSFLENAPPAPRESATKSPISDRSAGVLSAAGTESGEFKVGSPAADPEREAATLEARDFHRLGSGVVIDGRYQLLEKIGEGGMGEVWVARQSEPVKRKVALKLIKQGMDSRVVLQRFEQERQALALMDHPNIARVHDGGVTRSGQPYFVMELVNGLALNKFCDEQKLSPKARLELFVPICQAVQHAHQKGIIHRDLKPANILVTLIDGKAVPKVIDFGVAKATSGKLTDETMSTNFGAVVGTLEYMSPEQAGFSGSDVDTRSDIYSLGVILYELLTGLRPIDSRQLRSAAFNEMIRMICEEEPSRPSTRLSTDGSLPSSAAARQIEPARLMALLRGELDWIVMKCLEKQRDRRYETANALARDVQRFLMDEAVEARPPSRLYRSVKFVQRNRGLVASVALVACAIIVGAVAFAIQARIAQQQRDLAIIARKSEQAQRIHAEQQEQLAVQQRERAVAAERAEKARANELEQVSNFQATMLMSVDITGAGRELSADVQRQIDLELERAGYTAEERESIREGFRKAWKLVNPTDVARHLIDTTIISPAVSAVDVQFPEQPLVDALLRQSIASLYKHYSLFEKAVPLQLRALETRRRELGETHPETIRSWGQASMLYYMMGRMEPAIDHAQQELKLAIEHLGSDSLQTADAHNHRALVLGALLRNAEAEESLRAALEIRRKLQGETKEDTLVAGGNLAMILSIQGKSGEALPLMAQVIKTASAHLPPDHGLRAELLRDYGRLLLEAGEVSRAAKSFGESREFSRRVYGMDHRTTIIVSHLWADLELERLNLEAAEKLSQEVLAASARVYGGEELFSLRSRNRLIAIALRRGEVVEAARQVLELEEASRAAAEIPLQMQVAFACRKALTQVAQGESAAALRDLGAMESVYREVEAKQPGLLRGEFEQAMGLARLGLLQTAEDYAATERHLLAAQRVFSRTPGRHLGQQQDCIRALIELYTSWDQFSPGQGHGEKQLAWKAQERDLQRQIEESRED